MEMHDNVSDRVFFTPDNFSDIEQRREDPQGYRVGMHQAALKGDWEAARRIIEQYPEIINAKITRLGDTALHVATAETQTNFVEEVVGLVAPESNNLGAVNVAGNTALCLAAASGALPIAKALVRADHKLPMIRGNSGLTPLHMAALLGHVEMVRYLWPFTGRYLRDDERISLLITAINTGLYDAALVILREYPNLATTRFECQGMPLHVMARKHIQSRRTPQGWTGCCIRLCLLLQNFARKLLCSSPTTRLAGKEEEALGLDLVKHLWKVVMTADSNISRVIEISPHPLFVAVEAGNVMFVVTVLRAYPDLIWKFHDNGRSIFHLAVQYRQRDIFLLIHELGRTDKDLLANSLDSENNSLLHYAAMLPPENRLNHISRPAFQMQREILWYQAVRDLVQPTIARVRNNRGEKARDLFMKEHKQLRKAAGKWIVATASYSSVVATLILSLMFGVLMTIAEGNKSLPDAVRSIAKSNYQLFVLLYSVSLTSATVSVLVFLSAIASEYLVDKFVLSYSPCNLLLFGMTMLFVSISAMVLSFNYLFLIVFKVDFGLLANTLPILALLLILERQIIFLYHDFFKLKSQYNLISKGPHRLF